MKIGILTFHHAHNYGTVLQAYALKEYLRSQGAKAEIVNYKNEVLKKRYAEKLRMPQQQVTFRSILRPKNFARYLLAVPQAWYAQAEWEEQCRKFNAFIDSVLLDEKTEEILPSMFGGLDYDIFIVGSDQVWECIITGGVPDDAFFLNFTTQAKKIAYGASMRTPEIPKKFRDYYSKTIGAMDAVSVREEDIAAVIREIYPGEVCQVLDPSLLLDAVDYRKLEADIPEEEDRYVFAYFISEDPGMMACAEQIAEELGLPLIELHYYALKELEGHNVRADLGPDEFLSYMDHAAFVITNSFHGTVFSILFHKNFYSYFKEDTRKGNLLKELGLLERKLEDTNQIDLSKIIDYKKVDRKLEEMRKVSYDFLKRECGILGDGK